MPLLLWQIQCPCCYGRYNAPFAMVDAMPLLLWQIQCPFCYCRYDVHFAITYTMPLLIWQIQCPFYHDMQCPFCHGRHNIYFLIIDTMPILLPSLYNEGKCLLPFFVAGWSLVIRDCISVVKLPTSMCQILARMQHNMSY